MSDNKEETMTIIGRVTLVVAMSESGGKNKGYLLWPFLEQSGIQYGV